VVLTLITRVRVNIVTVTLLWFCGLVHCAPAVYPIFWSILSTTSVLYYYYYYHTRIWVGILYLYCYTVVR